MMKIRRTLSAVLSLVLAFALVLGTAPAAVFAAEEEQSESSKLLDIFYEKIVDEYYDDVYTELYELAVKEGLLDAAVAKVDDLIALIEEVQAQIPADVPEQVPEDVPEQIPEDWAEQIPEEVLDSIPEELLKELLDKYGNGSAEGEPAEDYEAYVASINALRHETEVVLAALNNLKASLTGNGVSTFEGLVAELEAVQETVSQIEILWIVIAENPESGVEYEQIVEALNALHTVEQEVKNTVIPAVKDGMEIAAEVAYDPLCHLLTLFLEKEVGTADEIADAVGIISNMSEEEIEARVKELIEEVTHKEYVISDESYYVAFGNVYDVNRTTYAEYLADDLGVALKNYTDKNMTIEQMAQGVESYKGEIAKADLITLNFAVVDSFLEVVNNAVETNPNYEMDWDKYLGEGAEVNEEKLDESLEKVYEALTEYGVKAEEAKLVVESVKYYVYRCIEHGVNLHKTIEKIRQINPDAVVVVVGAYNPLRGTTYNHEGEVIEIGEYIDYIFEAFSVYDLAYAVVMQNVTFVDAPAVEVNLDADELNAGAYADLNLNTLMPNKAGHEYIWKQIYNALILKYAEQECDHAWEWVQTKAPGCTEKGEETETCSKCGETRNTREIEALGHDWGEWVVDKEAVKNGEDGLKHRECKRCGEKEYEDIPAPTGDTVVGVALTTVAMGAALVVLTRKRKYFLG